MIRKIVFCIAPTLSLNNATFDETNVSTEPCLSNVTLSHSLDPPHSTIAEERTLRHPHRLLFVISVLLALMGL